MSAVTLGYWNFRGFGQTLRLLLTYTNTPFQEVQYQLATKEQWFEQDKKNLGFDFPNIPYLIDGDFKLTESIAIAKYIIKRSGRTELLGKTLQDEGLVENLIGVIKEILQEMRSIFGNPHWETAKAEVFTKIKPKIDYLKQFVGDR